LIGLFVLLMGSFVLPVAATSSPAGASAYTGTGRGTVTCHYSAKVAFSPALTNSGGGTGTSLVTGGKLSSCHAQAVGVSITSGKFTGSFAHSPITCAPALTGAAATLSLTWKGSYFGGKADYAATTIRTSTATGSFAGPATVTVVKPSPRPSDCSGPHGLKKLAMTGVLTMGTAAPTTWWKPGPGYLPWQWELDHPLDLSSPSDMGTGVTAYNGDTSPGDNPVVYDIDGIINPASTVSALHADGDHVICYIEVGSAGNYYTSAEEGLPAPTTYYSELQAAGVFGDEMQGYPEYYLNIESPKTVSIIESMIEHQCAAKGFDAVETDIDEEYADGQATTGFSLTKADEESYMTTLADFMHSYGLGWIIKNPDDTGDSYAADMEPLADGVLTEQCNQYDSCSLLSSYQGHKAIFNAEYAPETTAEFCTADISRGYNGAVFPVDLNGGRQPCN
jgi:hypothetical protein